MGIYYCHQRLEVVCCVDHKNISSIVSVNNSEIN